MQQDRRNSSADDQGHQRCPVPLSKVNRSDGIVARIGVANLNHKQDECSMESSKEEVKLPRVLAT